MQVNTCPKRTLVIRQQRVTLAEPWVMGILNATPDSFFAGSRCPTATEVEHRAQQLVAEGADVIDVGACSTRPGAEMVTEAEELARLRMALSAVRRVSREVYVSVDTFRARVARAAVLELGADMVNDIAGGDLDEAMWPTMAELGVPYIVMHMRGTPATMQQLTHYDNVVTDVVADLAHRLEHLRNVGVNNVIADPGFGFAKTLDQNYELLAHLDAFDALGVPLLVGVSRKSMATKLLGITPDEALEATTVLNTVALLQGAHIVRVHDVRAAVEARTLVKRLLSCVQQPPQPSCSSL